MDMTHDVIKQKAAQLGFKSQAFINGHYVDAQSRKTFDCFNPSTGKKIAEIAACDKADVDLAVHAARIAFESGIWSQCSPAERKKVLLRLADLLESHQFNLALLETLDTGKPIKESLTIDVPGAIKCLRWYAEAVDKIYGQVAPTASHIIATITREPLGVVAAVTPWNYPLYLACAKMAPALASGNSFIIKPAEQASLTTLYLAELATEAGVPNGIIHVLPGFGEIAGKALGLHPDIDGISFTGSTEVGKLFLMYSAKSNMKRIFLECGGKSPNIIMEDCPDIEKAAVAAIGEVLVNQGEVCCAPTRLLLHRPIKQLFIEKLLAAAKEVHPADPLDPETLMGAIIDDVQMKKILCYIEAGQAEGAKLILGGKRVRLDSGGYFIEPTIFDEATNRMSIAREEIFGPVLTILTFDTMEEAIHLANDTHYGLAASVWTKDINKAHFIAKALRAGVVSVNCINTGDITTPFGGYKQSGIGRELSLHAFDHYTESKTTWIELE